ncbi:MAG: PaaI family thioesterase [Lachnospiraceae bacterium]|nr:PaaI family thioesterase [Lachnospiraceae bacterium]
MQQDINLEKIREIFAKDHFATENGAVIEEVREHYARCSVELTERHFNAAGGVMGGVHFMLADFAFAVATNWNGMGVVSLSSTISYLGAVKGKKLIAEAECIKEGRTTVYYRVDVTDDFGNRIAEVGINGFRKN